jgi:hypothetical protein
VASADAGEISASDSETRQLRTMKRGQLFKRIEAYIRNGSFSVLGARPEASARALDPRAVHAQVVRRNDIGTQALRDMKNLVTRYAPLCKTVECRVEMTVIGLVRGNTFRRDNNVRNQV